MPQTNVPATKQRGKLLAFWLWLMVVANSLTALFYLFGTSALYTTYPSVPHAIYPLYALIGLINVGCAIALLQWKKWGFYAFCGSAVVAGVLNIIIFKMGIFGVISGFVGPIVLYFIMKSKWDLFE